MPVADDSAAAHPLRFSGRMLFFSELESDFRYQRMEVGSLGKLVGRLIVLFYSTALHQIACAYARLSDRPWATLWKVSPERRLPAPNRRLIRSMMGRDRLLPPVM